MLRVWGCTVAEADRADGVLEELLRATASPQPYTVAILDFSLPDLDGYQLAKRIRADKRLAKLQLILLSGFEMPPSEILDEFGVQAVVAKPLRASDLYNAVVSVANGNWKRPLPAAPSESTKPTMASRARILLVEDNEINQEVAREMILHLGHSCRCASSGKEALEVVAQESFDLILMDCQMPGMDGYEVTSAIRTLERDRASVRPIPIIALTAHAMKGDRERCLSAGMDDYLTKPLQADVLGLILCKWIGSQPAGGTRNGEGEASIDDAKNQAVVIERCSGNHALAQRLLCAFTAQAGEDIAAIAAAAQAADADKLARAAHRLKGAAANLGLETCRAAAADLEHRARAGVTEGIDPLLATLRAEILRMSNLKLAME